VTSLTLRLQDIAGLTNSSAALVLVNMSSLTIALCSVMVIAVSATPELQNEPF
jgi:hypothetical protein